MEPKLEEAIIELTRSCNLRCLHCGSDCGDGQEERTELDYLEWIKIIQDLKDFGLNKIVFSGGEPTIRHGFVQLMEYCHKIGFKFGFISNGFLFTPSLIEALEKYKPFAAGISLDGLHKTHNQIRQSEVSWSNALGSIGELQRLQIPVCISTTINRLNHSELLNLAHFLNFLEISMWQVQLSMPSGRMRDHSDLLIDEAIFKSVCLDLIKIRKLYPAIRAQGADCFCLASAGLIREGGWPGCGAGVSSIGIDTYGNVMPCLSMRDYPTCGNLLEKSMAEIWHSKAFDFNRQFQSTDLGENCSNCSYGVECRGGCNSQSLAYSGNLHNSPFCFYRSFSTNPQPRGDGVL